MVGADLDRVRGREPHRIGPIPLAEAVIAVIRLVRVAASRTIFPPESMPSRREHRGGALSQPHLARGGADRRPPQADRRPPQAARRPPISARRDLHAAEQRAKRPASLAFDHLVGAGAHARRQPRRPARR
jgi:hypothetical protein